MPISKNNKTAAVLVELSEQKNFFDKDIHKLLEQIQYDISAYMNKLETEKWYEIFANAISSGFDFIAVTDKDFNIVYINNNTVRFLGYKKEDLIGKHHSIFS